VDTPRPSPRTNRTRRVQPQAGKEADADGGNKEGAAEDAAEADGGKGGDKEAGAADATAAAE
jgi:hypothetical protein